MKKITADMLVCMNDYALDCGGDYPLRIDLAYARDDNTLFGERIYKQGARLYLYQDLANVILMASDMLYQAHRYHMILYDGLRTTDAQQRMLETQRVIDHPQWLREPRLLSPPGAGGHPRAMAVDVSMASAEGELLDMGTVFDYLAEDSSAAHNMAHREYSDLSPEVIQNRNALNNAILAAGERFLNKGDIEMPVEPLLQEWWDFRAPRAFYEQFAPLSDEDLPEDMRLIL